MNLVHYTTFNSYKAELDKLLTYDWNHAFDQFELERITAQYDADIALPKFILEYKADCCQWNHHWKKTLAGHPLEFFLYREEPADRRNISRD